MGRALAPIREWLTNVWGRRRTAPVYRNTSGAVACGIGESVTRGMAEGGGAWRRGHRSATRARGMSDRPAGGSESAGEGVANSPWGPHSVRALSAFVVPCRSACCVRKKRPERETHPRLRRSRPTRTRQRACTRSGEPLASGVVRPQHDGRLPVVLAGEDWGRVLIVMSRISPNAPDHDRRIGRNAVRW